MGYRTPGRNDLDVPPGRQGRAAVEIIGDVANFGAKVERDLNNELRGVDVDVKGVSAQISKGLDEGSRVGGDALSRNVRKGVDGARDELGRFVKSGASSGAGFALGFGGISGILGGVGKAAGKALGIGVKGAALASAANTAAGLVVALAPAVGAVGALAPAFIASKIAAGTFKLAMVGVADAVSAGITGDTQAFNEALEKMPPTAQAAMREIVGLKDSILGVRETVQGNFFAPLVGQIEPLGKAYLPMVTRELGMISSGFGQAAASTAQFLTLPTSVKSVGNSLGFTRQAINNVTAGVPGMVRAFLPLWEVGSSFLPGLTGGFDSLTQRVGAFMEKAQQTGQLHEFISGGLSVLGELGQLLGSIGSILSSVFQAASAAGGDLLGVVGQAVSQFAAFLNTAEGMSALTSLFQVLGQVAGIFGQALAVVLPVVGQLVGVLAGALQPILPVIASLIRQLAPVVAQVGTALGSILAPVIGVVAQLLSTLVPVIMPIVQALMGALMPVITALAPVITALGRVISTILGAALKALMPVFTALLPVVSELLVSVLTPLVPILGLVGELFLALMPAIVPLVSLLVALLTQGMRPLQAAIPVVATVLRFLIQALIAIVGPIAAAIGWVAKFLQKLLTSRGVGSVVIGVWNAIKSATSAVFGFIKAYITGVWSIIRSVTLTVWNFIKSAITSRINTIKAVMRTIGAAVSAVVGFFGRMRSGAASALSSMRAAVSSAVSAVVGFFGRLVSGAASRISSLISTVRGIGGRIRSAVGNLASLLVGAGRAVIQGLINGISNKLGSLRNMASKAAGVVRKLFPFSPAKEGPLSGRGSPDIAGAKIATMVAEGLNKRIPAIRAAAMRAADTARLSTAPLDTSGRGILSAALGSRTPTPALPPAAASSVTSVTFAAGAVTLNFYGAKPSPEEAYNAAHAAGRGLAAAFQARDVRTTVRTI